jgi:HK97 family phage portal protein
MVKNTHEIIEYNHCKIVDDNLYTFQSSGYNTISYQKDEIYIFTLNHLGISPVDGALKHSEILNTIQEYLLAIVKNGGRPSGIFSVSQFTSDEQKVRTRESINTVLSNIGNKGLAAIVEGEYQWQNIGISPRELQILDINHEQCKMICTYFQIPPILLGFEDRIYNNNYETARTLFMEDFIEPLIKSLLKIF